MLSKKLTTVSVAALVATAMTMPAQARDHIEIVGS